MNEMCRNMTGMDIEEVAFLEQQLFSDPWSEENLRESLAQEHAVFMVAEREAQDHSIEGGNDFIQASIMGYILFYQSFQEGEILRIGVRKDAQRQGTGRTLFQALCKECQSRGISRVLLDVREGNETAKRFYEKQGFVVDGIRPRFYRKPVEDAVLMSCQV